MLMLYNSLIISLIWTIYTFDQATDDDEGDNAKIKYSTDSEQFSIHPDTGAIYVRHDVLDYDEDTFTVTAVDSPTDGNGQSATASVQVSQFLL